MRPGCRRRGCHRSCRRVLGRLFLLVWEGLRDWARDLGERGGGLRGVFRRIRTCLGMASRTSLFATLHPGPSHPSRHPIPLRMLRGSRLGLGAGGGARTPRRGRGWRSRGSVGYRFGSRGLVGLNCCYGGRGCRGCL